MSEELPLPPPPETKNIYEIAKNALDEIRFYSGLILGLLLGILGNLVVSFLIETIHAFDTALFYDWLIVFVATLTATFFVFRWLAIRFVKPFIEVANAILPYLKQKQKDIPKK